MEHFPDTRHSLLIRIRDADDGSAWAEFLEIYRPMVYRIARRRGWQDADAQDLAQIVLGKISKRIDSFDPDGKAKFRTWLGRVCQNAITDELRKQSNFASTMNASAVEQVSLPRTSNLDVADEEYAAERRRAIFRWAAKKVAEEFEPSSWEAFRRTSIDGESTKSVAHELGMSVGAVYTAKSRIMRRLQQKVREHDDV